MEKRNSNLGKRKRETETATLRSKEDEVAQFLIELSSVILELQSRRCPVIPLLWGRKKKRSSIPVIPLLWGRKKKRCSIPSHHQHQHCFSQRSHSFGDFPDFLAKEKQLGDCSVLSIKSMEEGSPSKKHKGEIVDNAELPWAIKEKIQEMGGSEVKLVIQKSLFKTDLSPNHGRFSIPVQKMEKEAKNFVREREESIMEERSQQGQNQRLVGLPVFVMDPSLKVYNMHLKKWKMEKAVVYNITKGWMDVVRSNNLRVNDTVQLWSFRLNNDQSQSQLCFAFVKL